MRINALEDQETGFQCGDADDNDEGRYILFYFLFAKNTYTLMRKLNIILFGGFIMFKIFNDDNYDKAMFIIARVIWGIAAFIFYCIGIDVMVMTDISPVIMDVYAIVMIYAMVRYSVIDICKMIDKTIDKE